MASDRVEIQFPLSVRGTMMMREGEEFAPAITVYTGRLPASMERRVLSQNWQPVMLRLYTARQPTHDLYRRAIQRAVLGLIGVSVLRTKVGLSAPKYAGFACRSLAAVFAEVGRAHECALEVKLLDDEDRQLTLPKGRVWVRADSPVLIDGQPLALNVTVADAERQLEALLTQRRARFDEFRPMIGQWQELFGRFPQTFPAASKINCYVMRTVDGFLEPAFGYLQQQMPSQVDPAFYENALDIVLRRERLDRDQIARMELSDRRLANAAMQMLTLWCNYVPYVSDQAWVPVERREEASVWQRMRGRQSSHHIDMKHFDMEEFELAEMYNADDCEGVGAVIVRHHGYLLSTPVNRRSPALHQVCSLLSLYAPLLVLCGVTSGDLGGDFAALTAPGAKIGAHMFALFVPIARLMRMVQRVAPVKMVAPTPTWEFDKAANETHDLPILCGEGTGLLAPIPLDLTEQKRLLLPPRIGAPAARLPQSFGAIGVPGVETFIVADGCGMRHFTSVLGTRNPVFSNNSLWITDRMQECYPDVVGNGARKWYHISSEPGVPSHFYRTVQLALTPAFANQGSRVHSLVFMQQDPDTSDWSIGCTFNDLLSEGTANAGRAVGLYPEDGPSEKQMAELLDEMSLEPRPPVLRPPSETVGRNNTWDATAMVPSAREHEAMTNILNTVRRAALIAEVRTMLHAVQNAGAASFVGSPHLLADCACERRLAEELVRGGDREFVQALEGLTVDALITLFVAAMRQRAMPDSEPDRRCALVAEPAFNYEQWLQRGPDMVPLVSTALQFDEAALLPAGLHADFEHVTAVTGGLMPQVYFMVQY